MDNFGVIEVASAKTTNAPGWAYVPDTGTSSVPSQSVSAVHLHVNRNKRAARQSNAATGSSAQHHNDISARHDSKLQKEIEQLQRDSLSNVQIPIPSGGRDKDGKIRGHTPNVRKILASQKTFANHLDDFEAWRRTGEGVAGVGGGAGQSSAGGTPAPPAPTASANKKANTGSASHKKVAASSNARSRSGGGKKVATPASVAGADVTMTDAPPIEDAEAEAEISPAEPESKMLRPFVRPTSASHPEDSNPLLESWLPPLPTDEELRELIKAPPLNYIQARGTWGEDEGRYPVRSFCEVCGYWGRVRCMKCGTRVCALDCLDVHREECITRYGL
ncbi:hypothetical protein N0V93_001380 [Gnomoniopsis smithogilvyi]|uniref:HIT-type domain-containing protein n=1 Tax=Gnomoniopsis smithogilvyi TaxID=1191159 RepID=A0A9W8Z3E5_9PEZI|nr:hypothetical protein N0V93_001380 [Gnomoniopsis smithogilvyi]